MGTNSFWKTWEEEDWEDLLWMVQEKWSRDHISQYRPFLSLEEVSCSNHSPG